MALTNFQVFTQYLYQTMQETLAQNIALFNEATRGGLVLRSGNNQGDYSDKALYGRIAGLVRRRDAYAETSVSEKELAMLLDTSVKVAAGTPPIRIDKTWWNWIQRDPGEAGVVLGGQLAEETMLDMLNVQAKALVAALSNVGATVVHDGTGANLSLGVLNTAASLFGDRSAALRCWLMHSKPWHDMIGAAITNSNNLFVFGDIRVVSDGLGRPLVVADLSPLVYTSSGTKYHSMGLVPGGVIVEQNPDYNETVQDITGFENIRRVFQAEWSYNVGLKGFRWDKDNGGHSPSDAALATGTNWDKYATSVKDLPGVMVNST